MENLPGDLPSALRARAEETPDRVCVWFDDEPVTYAELYLGARRVAKGLAEQGLEKGDRFAIFLPNSVEFAELWLGGMLLGAIAVPVNLAYQGEFLRHQLRDSGSRLIAVHPDTLGPVAKVAADCDALESVVICGGDSEVGFGDKRVLSFDELLSHGTCPEDAVVKDGEPASILYTSGTTGRSKGVVLSHHYLVRIGVACIDPPRLTADDVVFVPMPLFHVSGLQALLLPLLAGSKSVVIRQFSVAQAWPTVRRYGCTGMVSVGPMIAMLMSLPADPSDRDLPLRYIGTAPLPAPREEIAERYGVDMQTMYGMTEAFPIAGVSLGEAFPEGSAGRAINDAYDVRIVDEDGKPAEAGTPGEIAVRPRMAHAMMEGYFANPEATQAQMHDGWFHTGDVGRVDADGYFYFLDRKKDALRRRGENISSIEVETAIRRHPGVADVAVHSVPSDLGEDEVKAVIVPLNPIEDTAELFAFFDEEIPRFARPRYVEFLEELPRNPVGRVLKFQLRERGLTPDTIERP